MVLYKNKIFLNPSFFKTDKTWQIFNIFPMMKVTQAQMLKIMGKEMIIVVSDLGRLSCKIQANFGDLFLQRNNSKYLRSFLDELFHLFFLPSHKCGKTYFCFVGLFTENIFFPFFCSEILILKMYIAQVLGQVRRKYGKI